MPRHRHKDEVQYLGMLQKYLLAPYYNSVYSKLVKSDDCYNALSEVGFMDMDIDRYLHAERAPDDVQFIYEDLDKPVALQNVTELAQAALDLPIRKVENKDIPKNDQQVYVLKAVKRDPLDPIFFDQFGNIVLPATKHETKNIWYDKHGREIVYIDAKGDQYTDLETIFVELDLRLNHDGFSELTFNPYGRPEFDSGIFENRTSIPEKLVWSFLVSLDAWHYAQTLAEYRQMLLYDYSLMNTANLGMLEFWLDDWTITNKNFIEHLLPFASQSLKHRLTADCIATPFDSTPLEPLFDQFSNDYLGTVPLNESLAGQIVNGEFRKVSMYARQFATTQTRLATGIMTHMRQTGSGIKYYRWLTSEDTKVRASHAALNGQIIAWETEPYLGHPGYDVNCRCIAVPVN